MCLLELTHTCMYYVPLSYMYLLTNSLENVAVSLQNILIPHTCSSYPFLMPVPHARSSYMYPFLIHVPHTRSSYPFLIHVPHARSSYMYMYLIPVPHARSLYMYLIPVPQTHSSYMYLIPVPHTHSSYPFLIPVLHTCSFLSLCAVPGQPPPATGYGPSPASYPSQQPPGQAYGAPPPTGYPQQPPPAGEATFLMNIYNLQRSTVYADVHCMNTYLADANS